MCGRYVSPEERAIEQFFELHRIAPFVSCFNATPSMLLPVVRAVEGRLVAEPMQVGVDLGVVESGRVADSHSQHSLGRSG